MSTPSERRRVEYTARVHHEDDGTYWPDVIEFPGCFASGHTFDELIEALRECIALYVDESDRSKMDSVEVDQIKVAVPA